MPAENGTRVPLHFRPAFVGHDGGIHIGIDSGVFFPFCCCSYAGCKLPIYVKLVILKHVLRGSVKAEARASLLLKIHVMMMIARVPCLCSIQHSSSIRTCLGSTLSVASSLVSSCKFPISSRAPRGGGFVASSILKMSYSKLIVSYLFPSSPDASSHCLTLSRSMDEASQSGIAPNGPLLQRTRKLGKKDTSTPQPLETATRSPVTISPRRSPQCKLSSEPGGSFRQAPFLPDITGGLDGRIPTEGAVRQSIIRGENLKFGTRLSAPTTTQQQDVRL
jgi:hypothetical protein